MSHHEQSDTGERPFRQLEGAYAEIKTVRSGFIEFDSSFGGLSIRPDEQDVRILVGRMGAGKSINLRRLYDYCERELEPDVYTAAFSRQSASALTTTSVKYFCRAFNVNELTEQWKLLWRRAIVRATVSHLTHSRLGDYVRNVDLPTLRSSHRLLSDQGIPTDNRRYEGQQEYPYSDTGDTLRELIAESQSERLTWEQVLELRQRARDVFRSSSLDLPTILWHNGLLGYLNKSATESVTEIDMCTFYLEPTVGSARIPDRQDTYVFHPILLDCVPELTPSGNPVYPGS